MAVNFSLLPPEEPVPVKPPSSFLWIVIFFVIAIVGVFSVLLLWPKDEPTQTPWFWICVTLYPFGFAAFIVLRRYSAYEGWRLNAIAWNDARKDHERDVFELASRPLAVLAATCRFSCEAAEDDFSKLLDESVRLEPRTALKPDAPPINARWFESRAEDGSEFKDDRERRRKLLTWAFCTATGTVAEAIRSLPLELRLKVQLVIPGLTSGHEALVIWNREWVKADLRPIQVSVLCEPPDLMYADTWLDRVNQKLDGEARLLVCVKLNPVLEALPPDGSSEALAVLLLVPQVLAQKFALASLATMHRPNGVEDCTIHDALSRALRWGGVGPSEIQRSWRGGLDMANRSASAATLVKAGISTKTSDVDAMVGHAGEIAPWVVVACAASAAGRDHAPQLAITTGKSESCFTIVRNVK